MIVATCMNSVGMEKESFFSFIPGTLLMLASCWLLPKYIGIDAVIVANLLSLSVEIVINLFLLHKKIKLRFGFIKTLISVTCISLFVKVLTDFVSGAFDFSSGFWTLVVSGIAGAASYAALAYVFGIGDIKTMLSNVKKRRRATPSENQKSNAGSPM